MNKPSTDQLKEREAELVLLRPFAERFPNVDAAMAEIARLAAVLTLPKGTIHVISDIHGEDQKLRHVINNASGTLRPFVEKLFKAQMEPRQFQEFLTTADPRALQAMGLVETVVAVALIAGILVG